MEGNRERSLDIKRENLPSASSFARWRQQPGWKSQMPPVSPGAPGARLRGPSPLLSQALQQEAGLEVR